MKKLKILTLALALGAAPALFVIGCKKKEPSNPATSTTTVPDDDGQASQDNRDVQSENDNAVNDINNVIGDQAKLTGRSAASQGVTGVTGTVCGLSTDTTGLAVNGTILLNFNGTTCNNRNRTGSIRVTVVDYKLGKRWKMQGCSLKVEYTNYKITRPSDGASIMLNGTQYLVNESGGTWWNLLIVKDQTSLSSSVRGTALSATYADGKTAIYNINRKFTYTIPGGILTCKGEGVGSLNGMNNLENYGTTRDGAAFTSQVVTPIVWSLTCGAGAPTSGEVNVVVSNKQFALNCLFGTDVSGNAVTVGANSCPYGWKMTWSLAGRSKSKIFKYW